MKSRTRAMLRRICTRGTACVRFVHDQMCARSAGFATRNRRMEHERYLVIVLLLAPLIASRCTTLHAPQRAK
jgi:hypothetical protein